MATVGGTTEVEGNESNLEMDSLARFAVEEHNKKANAVLHFGKVVSSELQSAVLHFAKGLSAAGRIPLSQNVVGGHILCIKLEATDGGKKKVYEALVWEKPWLNFKELQEFKLIGDAPSGSSS